MDQEEFVSAIKVTVTEPAVSATLRILERPPGRKPVTDVADNALWYRSLDDAARQRLSTIVKAAVDQAVFGFLCVLDGVRAIENGDPKGRLELRHIGGKTTVLNPPEGVALHDLY